MLAQEAAFQLGLEEVLLVPTGEAPHKQIDPEPGRDVRLQMARLAAATDGTLEASDVETSREGPSFTFHTLELLRDARPNDEFVFLMGADMAADLEGWRNPQRLLEVARLGIARTTPVWMTRRFVRSRSRVSSTRSSAAASRTSSPSAMWA